MTAPGAGIDTALDEMSAPGAGPGQILIKAEYGTLVWSEILQDGGRAIVKLYRRRPFYDPLRRWFIPYRAEREFKLLSHLVRNGVPCSVPLSWSHGRRDPHGLYEMLVTREVAGATALDKLLQRPGVVADLSQLLRLVRSMHDCGVSHGGLAPRNILVSFPAGGAPAFHVIDMSYGHVFPRGIAATRMATFDLLDLVYRLRPHFPAEHCNAWLAAYGLDDSAKQGLMHALGRYRPRGHWAHLRRGETDLRAAIARLPGPRSPRGRDSRPAGPPSASGT
ncbi:MAG: lipopolysaccharide kinase InaA family protein [Gammaproteobacteria bacterium]|nr:lipopolysaccharide kinase InaA family protein [Gammaproteobacteria bacterium]